jgi:large subunit ribosomal protein L34e
MPFVYRKTPSGKRTRLEVSKKPAGAKCAVCEKKLNAVPKRAPGELTKLSKTQKRPERVFGGVLCGECTRRTIIARERLKKGLEVADLRISKYAKALKK